MFFIFRRSSSGEATLSHVLYLQKKLIRRGNSNLFHGAMVRQRICQVKLVGQVVGIVLRRVLEEILRHSSHEIQEVHSWQVSNKLSRVWVVDSAMQVKES